MSRRPLARLLLLGSGLLLASASARVMAQDSQQPSDKTADAQATAEEPQARPVETFALSDGSVAERQSVDSFTSLEDGQPGEPWGFEIQFDFGWETESGEHDPVSLTPELKLTLGGNPFLEDTKLMLSAPMVFGLGGVDGNADLEFGWQQRWIAEDGWIPTVATLAEVRFPTGYHSSGVDGTLTGILAKDCGPGTLFFNAFAETANGNNVDDLRHFQWGLRAGYKWRVSERFALTGDYVHQCSEEEGHGDINLLEISGQWEVTEHVTIGPGVFIGLDDNDETPNFGAGIRLLWSF